jgi:hypothetical protein
MINYKFVLLSLLIINACSTTNQQVTKSDYEFALTSNHKSITVTSKGIEHEFHFLDYDKSEDSLRFNVKIKNITKENKNFNVKDVVLVIKSSKDSKIVQWKIPARDASLADKELFGQIAELEKKNNSESINPDLFASNFAPNQNRNTQTKSIKQRQQELANKTFYTSKLAPGEILTGLMYFAIEDSSFLKAPATTMYLEIKGEQSKNIQFKYQQVQK